MINAIYQTGGNGKGKGKGKASGKGKGSGECFICGKFDILPENVSLKEKAKEMKAVKVKVKVRIKVKLNALIAESMAMLQRNVGGKAKETKAKVKENQMYKMHNLDSIQCTTYPNPQSYTHKHPKYNNNNNNNTHPYH